MRDFDRAMFEEDRGKLTNDQIIEILKQILPADKYDHSSIQYLTRGGSRLVFSCDWGKGKEKVVVKVDRQDINNPRARRYVLQRGYDTEHEVDAMTKVRDPERHCIMKTRDYYEHRALGTVTVETLFEDSKTLEDRVTDGNIDRDEFRAIFLDVLEGARYFRECGLYHRDLKPSNILVSKRRAMITDNANVCEISNLKDQPLPTLGSKSFSDPTVCEMFTGKEGRYNEGSEIYSIGASMYFALTGKALFDYDPDARTATIVETGETLFSSDRSVDFKKHDKVLKKALRKLPWRFRRYRDIIRRCLTSDLNERYKTIDSLVDDFKDAGRVNILGRPFVLSGLTALVGALGVAGFVAYENVPKTEPVYLAFAKFEPIGLDINNNIGDLEITSWTDQIDNDASGKRFVKAKACQELKFNLLFVEGVRPKKGFECGVGSLPGRVYVEGYTGNNVYVYSSTRESIRGSEIPMFTSKNLKVPCDIKDGTYKIVFEIYKPYINETTNYSESSKIGVNFGDDGRILTRKNIELLVGEPRVPLYISEMSLDSFPSDIYFEQVDKYEKYKRVDNDVAVELLLPESGYYSILGKGYSSNLVIHNPLDKPKSLEEQTLVVITRKAGKIFGYEFIPVIGTELRDMQGRLYNTDWRFYVPGRDFYQRAVAYREAIDRLGDKLMSGLELIDYMRQSYQDSAVNSYEWAPDLPVLETKDLCSNTGCDKYTVKIK